MILTANGAVFDVVQTGAGRDLVLFHSLLTDRTVFDARRLAYGDGPLASLTLPAAPRSLLPTVHGNADWSSAGVRR